MERLHDTSSGFFRAPISVPVLAHRAVHSRLFQPIVIGAILVSAVLIGIETSEPLARAWASWLRGIDRLLVTIFIVEIALKMASDGKRFWRFFLEPWNVFDFIVVATSLLPAAPGYLLVLRLFRVLRVLRLVSTIPKLQLLVGALFKSLPSMAYVIVLLSILFYIYAVIGTFLFKPNDVEHFGTLGASLLTLFQIVTLEGWADIMALQVRGATPFPMLAPAYFVSFIVVGTMIILNLFIGVVVNGMAEMQEELERDTVDVDVLRAKLRKELLSIQGSIERLQAYLTRLDGERGPP